MKSKNINLALLVAALLITGAVLIFMVMSFGRGSTESETTQETEQAELPSDPRLAAVAQLKQSMTDEQKAGQLFLARVPESNADQDLVTYNLGGYLIFAQDVEGETPTTLSAKIANWQSLATIPMLIGSDEEGGDVTRVSEILETPFASPGELYAIGGIPQLVEDASNKSKTLMDMGINLNLAPVADVAIDPNSFIYSRTLMLPETTTLEEAAQITSEYVVGVVGAMKQAGIGCSLKHFPGYGENGDTHTDIIHDPKELAVFETIDFIPFKAGIDAGAGSVLISHNIAEAIDPNLPASISPAVHEVLRNQLGFTGVIVSDDIDMAGLSDFTDKNTAAVASLAAGTDLLISSTYSEQIPVILSALENGTISRERFEEAVDHVLLWKYDLGLLTNIQ